MTTIESNSTSKNFVSPTHWRNIDHLLPMVSWWSRMPMYMQVDIQRQPCELHLTFNYDWGIPHVRKSHWYEGTTCTAMLDRGLTVKHWSGSFWNHFVTEPGVRQRLPFTSGNWEVQQTFSITLSAWGPPKAARYQNDFRILLSNFAILAFFGCMKQSVHCIPTSWNGWT
jgi:hypothetical protein